MGTDGREPGGGHVPPVEELHGVRLGFRRAVETCFSDPPYQTVRLIPEFPHVRSDIAEATDIVWDRPQLCESIRRPGGYDILDCSCGLGDHSDLVCFALGGHPRRTRAAARAVPGDRPLDRRHLGRR